MNILTAWGNSLAIFKPKNLKLFLLVTLKSAVDGFKTWIKYFWWVLLIPAITAYLPFHGFGGLMLALLLLEYAVIPLTLLLAIRPSTDKKNCAYFRSYAMRILILLFAYAGLYTGAHLVVWYLNEVAKIAMQSPSFSITFSSSVVLILNTLGAFGYYYLVNVSLFYLDSDGSIAGFLKSWIYGFKMVLYNLPFYLVYHIVYRLSLQILTPVMKFIMVVLGMGMAHVLWVVYIGMLSLFILQLFTLCFLTNLYVKKIHDQFTLYFGKND